MPSSRRAQAHVGAARSSAADRVRGPPGSTPLSSTLRPRARYMAPVSRKGTPEPPREPPRRRCSCPRPTGPSMATIRGAPLIGRPRRGLALRRAGSRRRRPLRARAASRRLAAGLGRGPLRARLALAAACSSGASWRTASRSWGSRGLDAALDLALGQLAQGAQRQVRIAQRADRHPPQLLHRVADALEHLADLPRPPLGELDHPPGVLALVVVAAPPRAAALARRVDPAGAVRSPSSTMPARSRSSCRLVRRRPCTLTS